MVVVSTKCDAGLWTWTPALSGDYLLSQVNHILHSILYTHEAKILIDNEKS